VAACVDHHHQDGTDAQGSERAAAPGRGADREHQKERANRFDRVFTFL